MLPFAVAQAIERLRAGWLDPVFPRPCIGCGVPCGRDFHSWCWECAGGIHYLTEPMCARCGEPVEGRVDGAFECHACRRQLPAFDQARSAARFDGVVRESVHALKYRSGLWMVPDLTALLEACVRSWYHPADIDAVVAVPLHPTRFRTRGFNQAALLAARLARRIGAPFDGRRLRRIRSTESQTRLTAGDRATNVRGAFVVARPAAVIDRRLLLVDDVMTTGATVAEVSRVLKDAGAAAVRVATVARG